MRADSGDARRGYPSQPNRILLFRNSSTCLKPQSKKTSKLSFMSLLKKVVIVAVAWVVCVLVYLEFFAKTR